MKTVIFLFVGNLSDFSYINNDEIVKKIYKLRVEGNRKKIKPKNK